LRYEEAMLLTARIDIARGTGREPDPADAATCARILDDLGARVAPRPSVNVA
jgi:hypothetical protein